MNGRVQLVRKHARTHTHVYAYMDEKIERIPLQLLTIEIEYQKL